MLSSLKGAKISSMTAVRRQYQDYNRLEVSRSANGTYFVHVKSMHLVSRACLLANPNWLGVVYFVRGLIGLDLGIDPDAYQFPLNVILSAPVGENLFVRTEDILAPILDIVANNPDNVDVTWVESNPDLGCQKFALVYLVKMAVIEGWNFLDVEPEEDEERYFILKEADGRGYLKFSPDLITEPEDDIPF